MNSLIMSITERVARAIHASLPDAATGWDALGEDARAGYLLAAHRAIGAMRLPSDAMLREGGRRDLAQDAANVWERMIFTALSPPG